jgi:hypothetical protein
MPREFGTDPYGILARGAPTSGGGAGATVGKVPGGTYGVRVPVGGGATIGAGLGSGAVGGGGAVGGVGVKMPTTTFGTLIKRKAKGGAVKKMAKGGKVSSASKRADGCATKGKTRGKMV